MSSVNRGNNLEILAKDILERDGYVVHRAIRAFIRPKQGGRPFVQSNDIFRCFDLIAISSHKKPLFVQVTTINNLYGREKKINHLLPFAIQGVDVEAWGWQKGRGKMYFIRHRRNTDLSWDRMPNIYRRDGR